MEAVAQWSLPPAVVPTRVGGNPLSKRALLMTWKKLRVDILNLFMNYEISMKSHLILDTRWLYLTMYIVRLNMEFTGIVLICYR